MTGALLLSLLLLLLLLLLFYNYYYYFIIIINFIFVKGIGICVTRIIIIESTFPCPLEVRHTAANYSPCIFS